MDESPSCELSPRHRHRSSLRTQGIFQGRERKTPQRAGWSLAHSTFLRWMHAKSATAIHRSFGGGASRLKRVLLEIRETSRADLSSGRAFIYCHQPPALAPGLSAADGERPGETWRNHPPRANPSRWRPAKERARRIPRGHGDASLCMGALGLVSKAMRGPGSGQSAQVEDGRIATHLAGNPILRCDRLIPNTARRAGAISSSFAKAPIPHAADRSSFLAPGQGDRPRSFHGRGLYYSRRRLSGLRKHWAGTRPYLFREGSLGNSGLGCFKRQRKEHRPAPYIISLRNPTKSCIAR